MYKYRLKSKNFNQFFHLIHLIQRKRSQNRNVGEIGKSRSKILLLGFHIFWQHSIGVIVNSRSHCILFNVKQVRGKLIALINW